MNKQLGSLIDQLSKDGRAGLHESIAISWISYTKVNPEACSGIGASFSQEKLIYPASVVKLIYAVAIEAWIQKELLPEDTELRHAQKMMITESSNDATSLVVDSLTGTTSGPRLSGASWESWKTQRNLINIWLQKIKWKELKGINCCQKTWNDEPYGRDKDFYGSGRKNQNLLTTLATARMFEAIMTNEIVSPLACQRIRKILSRSLDLSLRKKNPENQIDSFLGEGLPAGTRIWSKAGLMSQARHDAAWWISSNGMPMLLIVFCQGRDLANDTFLLPAIAQELNKFHIENYASKQK